MTVLPEAETTWHTHAIFSRDADGAGTTASSYHNGELHSHSFKAGDDRTEVVLGHWHSIDSAEHLDPFMTGVDVREEPEEEPRLLPNTIDISIQEDPSGSRMIVSLSIPRIVWTNAIINQDQNLNILERLIQLIEQNKKPEGG